MADRTVDVLLIGGGVASAAAAGELVGGGFDGSVLLAARELGDSGDEGLRTSASRVWAAGDVCEYASAVHGRRIRVEHTEHASAQGAFVARAILGAEEPYTEVPSSTATSPTGPRSSTSGPPARGTRRSSPARSRAGSSASGTSSRVRCRVR
jgi:NADPH-dependent 2,4-dienoyl-CoA reductase/sulfur reductase-like enzyme